MKKLLYIAFLATSLISCKKDTNNNVSGQGDLTDVDGNKYPVVKICNQTWMAKNLNVSRYRNGDVIPEVKDPVQWANLTTGAWCYYENATSNGTIYGKLYNCYAVYDNRGLAPEGWHIPTDDELTTLTDECLGGASVAGGKMKSTGTQYWQTPNNGATNSSGFSLLPGGYRSSNGSFKELGLTAFLWSSTKNNEGTSYIRDIGYDSGNVSSDDYSFINGFSIRCVKD